MDAVNLVMDKIRMRTNSSVFFATCKSSLGINITGCGYQHKLPAKWVPKVRYFDTYALSYIAAGSAWYENGASPKQFVPEGSCIVFFPGIRSHFIPNDRERWEEYWIHFQGPVIRALESEGILQTKQPVFPLTHHQTIRHYFDEAVSLSQDGLARSQKRLSGHLFSLLNEVVAQYKEEQFGPHLSLSGPIPAIIQSIRKNPSQKWDIKQLAKESGMSYQHFMRLFKKWTSHTPHRFVNFERMKLACQFLSQGCSIQDACFKIGMEDPYHFSRLFKSVMGRSPLYFKEQYGLQ